jgi:hypothetical protein
MLLLNNFTPTTEVGGAAVHKCLVCDKPVNPSGERPDSPTWRGANQQSVGYDKAEDAKGKLSNSRPATSGPLGRPSSTTRAGTGVRSTTEVNILRSTMEALPPVFQQITDSVRLLTQNPHMNYYLSLIHLYLVYIVNAKQIFST